MKTQRRLVAATALAAVTALLAACGGGGSSGGTSAGGSSPRPGEIVYAQSSPTEGFNADSCWQYSISMLPLVYDQLVRIQAPDGDGLGPGLAESWEYDPATTSYLLTLRDGATFSDGSPVTPADVVFSVEQWMAGVANGYIYENLAGAEAVGDNQVRLTMNSDDPVFINSLAMCSSSIYPANFGGRTAEEFFADPVGAGPFQLANWSQQGTPTERIELTPNPNYWGPAPEVDRFVFESIADPAQRALQFRSGAVDIVGVLDISVARQFQADTLDVAAPAISALLVPNQASGPSPIPI
ncbi:ABC transporter substrate-binding protein [Millisia brevis]|uniref:ABC transporter substrate-binding protein n=1 Tax=Millisia brevis TaxID=264148 RepID=UPI00082A3094|nr:ABC transporter substrate-binding protein [Millisia brevis]